MGVREYQLSEIEVDEKELDDLVIEMLENRYDPTLQISEDPEYAITVDGKGLVERGGSLIGVYGLPKARKSSLMAMFACAILAENKRFGLIDASHLPGNKVVYIDSEQGDREIQRVHNHVVEMCGRKGQTDFLQENYFVLKLRRYSHKQRLAMIDRTFTAINSPFSNVSAIFLDGVVDFVSNANEASESKELVDRILMWADRLGCPLFAALHLNRSATSKGKGVGFLGNYLENKSSYNIVAEVEHDGGPSIIKPGMTRNGQRFKPFQITNVEDGLPNAGRPKFHDPVNEEIFSSTWTTRSRSTKVEDLPKPPVSQTISYEHKASFDDI